MKVKDLINILKDCDQEADIMISAPDAVFHPFTYKTFYYEKSTKRKIGYIEEKKGIPSFKDRPVDGLVMLQCVEPEKVDPYEINDSYHPTEKIWKIKYNRYGSEWENTSYFVDRGEIRESDFCEDVTPIKKGNKN